MLEVHMMELDNPKEVENIPKHDNLNILTFQIFVELDQM